MCQAPGKRVAAARQRKGYHQPAPGLRGAAALQGTLAIHACQVPVEVRGLGRGHCCAPRHCRSPACMHARSQVWHRTNSSSPAGAAAARGLMCPTGGPCYQGTHAAGSSFAVSVCVRELAAGTAHQPVTAAWPPPQCMQLRTCEALQQSGRGAQCLPRLRVHAPPRQQAQRQRLLEQCRERAQRRCRRLIAVYRLPQLCLIHPAASITPVPETGPQ